MITIIGAGPAGSYLAYLLAKLDFEKVLKNFGTIPEGTNFGIKSSVLNTFVKANNIKTRKPNFDDKNNKTIGNIITNATIYLDCWMTGKEIKKLIAQSQKSQKAFYSDFLK